MPLVGGVWHGKGEACGWEGCAIVANGVQTRWEGMEVRAGRCVSLRL